VHGHQTARPHTLCVAWLITRNVARSNRTTSSAPHTSQNSSKCVSRRLMLGMREYTMEDQACPPPPQTHTDTHVAVQQVKGAGEEREGGRAHHSRESHTVCARCSGGGVSRAKGGRGVGEGWARPGPRREGLDRTARVHLTLYNVSSQMDVLKHVSGTAPDRASIILARPANTCTHTQAGRQERECRLTAGKHTHGLEHMVHRARSRPSNQPLTSSRDASGMTSILWTRAKILASGDISAMACTQPSYRAKSFCRVGGGRADGGGGGGFSVGRATRAGGGGRADGVCVCAAWEG
jgi:hypothetical protein